MPDLRPTIRRINEWELTPAMQEQTRTLLRECFPSYPDRNYFKLPPHMRYVATLGEMLVAQVGVEHRVLRIGDVVVNAFGIVDLCVNEDHRSCGIATSLLTEITTYAQDCGVDFIVLSPIAMICTFDPDGCLPETGALG